MRAFVIPHAGAASVEFTETAVPIIDDDEMLVRVRAVGVGIHDSYFLPGDARYPYPIGIEAAGIIDELGSAVPGYHAGGRIAFVSSMQPKGGTWAEFVAVKGSSLIVPIPEGLEFVEAAALPVAGNTVLRALGALAPAHSGRSLFIAGGSGAIGTLAIQVARARGWRVAASASEVNHQYMRSLGAEKAVDYHNPDWTNQVRGWAPGGVDAVIAVQPGSSAESLTVVKDRGELITISGDAILAERGVRMQTVPYQVDVRDGLVQLMSDVAAGALHVEIERIYPFEDALAALAKVQTRRARGKVVLRLA